MEKLLPVAVQSKRLEPKKEQTKNFSDTLSVNQLLSKPIPVQLLQLDNLDDTKNKRQYVSFKQEQLCRLNRESKLKRNEELCNYFQQNGTHKPRTEKSGKGKVNFIKQIKEANTQVDEANSQLAEINRFLEAKNANSRNNFGLSKLSSKLVDGTLNTKYKNVFTDSSIRHMCTKGISNNKIIDNYSKVIENFEKQLKIDEQKYKKIDKFRAGTGDTADTQARKQKVADKLNTVDAKLKNVKERYLNDNKLKFDPKEARTSITKSRFKSIKDLKIDKNKILEMENEIKKRKKEMPPDDPEETRVLYENASLFPYDNEDFNSSRETSQEDINATVNAIMNRYNITEDTLDKKFATENTGTDNDMFPTDQNDLPKTKSVALDTEMDYTDDLERSVMKSDYLMREFNLNSKASFPLPILENERMMTKQETDVWNTKSPAKSQKWPKEIEYLMT